MANSNNWGEIYNSTWWGDKAWSANTLFIDSAPPGFGLNLLKGSEDLDNTIDWDRLPDTTDVPSVSANTITDPNGGTTAERVDFSANRQARLQQRVTLEASKQYTFSVYAKVNTGTQNFRLRNVTLGDAESKTATTSWTRFSYTFTTTTAGDYDLSLQNNDNTARTLEFWGAMLNEGATAGDYVKTEASVSGSAPTPAYSGFGDSFGGVTAYYSLRQFTEAETLNAIRVRRSSDDTEQDIGFDSNGDLDTTALLAFVNASGNAYASNFTSGNEDMGETGGTGADGQSIADVSDAYKFTQDGSTGIHRAVNPTNTNIVGGNISISFDYYLPSGQTSDRILFRTNNAGDAQVDLTTTDAWTTYSTTFSGIAGDQFWFYSAIIGQGLSFAGNGSDHFYLKNIVVTQTDADGAVTTFYDQTGNGNNATNSTESEQPLVVSGGTLVTENGKAAIDLDGSAQVLQNSVGASDLSNVSMFVTAGISQTNDDATIVTYPDIGNNGGVSIGQGGLGTAAQIGLRYRISGVDIDTDGIALTTGQKLLSALCTASTTAELFENGTAGALNVSARLNYNNFEIGAAGNSAFHFDGTIQEVVIFESDQSTNRTGIETNINDHFSIYP